MKRVCWALAFLTIAVVPTAAQQTSDQKQAAGQAKRTETKSTSDDIDDFVAQRHAQARAAVAPACKDLDSLGEEMEEHFKAENPQNKVDPILAAIRGRDSEKQWTDIPSDAPDSTWDTLVVCAGQTKSQSQRAEALRVLAIWEKIRADNFRKRYVAVQPVKSPKCQNLGDLVERVDVAVKNNEQVSTAEVRSVAESLRTCAEDSEKLNGDRNSSEALIARGELFRWIAIAYNNLLVKSQTGGGTEENTEKASTQSGQLSCKDLRYILCEATPTWRDRLANPSSLVALRPEDKPGSAELSQVADHNRRLCDQVITVAGLTPNGLVLYMPPEGQRFMAKNAQNYPRMCLVQDAENLVPGVPRYLLVWAYSENAFAGFQPVQQTTTAPVSGSGTLTNVYGQRWNFTYNGTLTEIDTVEAPYVLQSRSLYLWAYDEKGNVVSRHSITTSNQTGGDASYAAGYNAGALISLLWNNPSHLIKRVLKDVQKVSGH